MTLTRRPLVLLLAAALASEGACTHVPLRACAIGAAAVHSIRPRRCEAAEKRGRKKKSMRLHEMERDIKGNEYYAGGIDDQGHGSGTVLLLPDEPENKENATNATASAAEEAEAEAPRERFKGAARTLE
mmetsp:Transcript_61939/g.184349  ORF Transcript_61939/g.184349 Transcript_61939/m.184349 type:complete len:129 (-) Transcript_61939:231-617(-)